MNEILKELSWRLKLKVLNELPGTKHKQYEKPPMPPTEKNVKSENDLATTSSNTKASSKVPASTAVAVAIEVPRSADMAVPELLATSVTETTPTSTSMGKFFTQKIERRNEGLDELQLRSRVVGIELLRSARRENSQSDDNDMRLKLFRLMYETVRDSDLKVKRAELIKDHYINSSTFEIGYLVGDITDKANIITDISMTLKRFYSEWKPIEHINAYEQIANQAIEITHLIDLVRLVNKKAKDNSGTPSFV